LTAAYVEDCSYSPNPTETCNITNAVTGQFYILLITNYSNQVCNIDFSQTGGNGTTDCCILGDAGDDNITPGYTACSSDPSFNMENELNGLPSTGGTWYDNTWNVVGNNFNPATGTSGIYSYIVLGSAPAGSTVTCPDDTASLSITINPDPIITFSVLNDICTNEPPVTLNNAIPLGGIYSGNGVVSGIFTPSNSILGSNTITYNLTDANGCSDVETQTITVNETPSVSLGSDTEIPCRSSITITPTINGGTLPYSYLWNDGSSSSDIIASGGTISLTLTDANGCTESDDVIITQDITPIVTISGGGPICDDGTTTDIDFTFSGLLPWNLTYTNGSVSSTINNIDSNSYSITTSNPGEYNIILADDPNACEADIIGNNIIITVNPLPTPVIDPEFYEIYPGEEISLITGTYSYYWWYNNNDSLISENEILIVDSTLTTYLIVEDDKGCVGISATAVIEYIPRVELFIPNTFTPNGDEHNDLFVTIGGNIETFYMIITNRWGEVVYTTNDINKFWDGKFKRSPAEQGTYSYRINIIGTDKRPFNTSGTVNVLY
ncbi:MAG: gliding motility-associated C-terminal domain-containing protein, partial [Bacteroidota bacterium]|nr:gliding motility-associated C-terminal domain-containing protein [Bacteroidota bacterium]